MPFMKGRFLGRPLPLVIAHRGYSARFPENTLPAFEAAVAEGADMIELDVAASRDGHPVVIHDDTLERTTAGTGRVGDYTLAELKCLDAGSWMGPAFGGVSIPSLSEVFDALGGRVLVNVEIKPGGLNGDEGTRELIQRVIDCIRRKDLLSSVVVSSGDYQVLRNVRILDRKIMLAVLGSGPETNIDVEALVKAVGGLSYNPDQAYVTGELVGALHRAGILVFPWSTLIDNTAGTMERMLKLGADGFFANDPALFRAIAHR
jgi:glycerophosphoryl diester phosphodiesterase